MIEGFFNFLTQIGVLGLFIAIIIKGSTIPIPTHFIIISYGYLLQPSLMEMIWIAGIMSLLFTLASYLPYTIGNKLEEKIERKFGEKLRKAQHWFNKYGEWSVAFTRPFTIGIYISYVAGIGKVNLWKYGILTFVGVLPWSFAILYVSKALEGNFHLIREYFQSYALPVSLTILFIFATYLLFLKKFKKYD